MWGCRRRLLQLDVSEHSADERYRPVRAPVVSPQDNWRQLELGPFDHYIVAILVSYQSCSVWLVLWSHLCVFAGSELLRFRCCRAQTRSFRPELCSCNSCIDRELSRRRVSCSASLLTPSTLNLKRRTLFGSRWSSCFVGISLPHL